MKTKLNKLCRVLMCVGVASSLLLSTGCSIDGGSLGGSVARNNTTGQVTTTLTGTITFKRAPLQQLSLWMYSLSGTQLASMDPNQAIMSYSLSNAVITSTNGSFIIALTDDTTGITVGQQTFAYVVSGNGLLVQDPAAVSSWLNQFASYSNLDVTVTANTNVQAVASGNVTVTNNGVYQGLTYTSASTSWQAVVLGGGGGTCHTPRCPVQ
jgi:hypothetical protein